MDTGNLPEGEILHSENHSKLSSEEVAKALARHNRKGHSGGSGTAAAMARAPEKPKKAKQK